MLSFVGVNNCTISLIGLVVFCLLVNCCGQIGADLKGAILLALASSVYCTTLRCTELP